MFSKKHNNNDSLTEILIGNQTFKLNKLLDIMTSLNFKDNNAITEFAIKENIIDKESLLNYINTQLKINAIFDNNIESLRYLNDVEKWERLMAFENLGEILVRKKVLKIEQLIEILELQEHNPSISLEELLLSRSLVTKKDIYEALEFQLIQEQVVEESYMEMANNDLYGTQ